MARSKPQPDKGQQPIGDEPAPSGPRLEKSRGHTLEAGVTDYDEDKGQDVEIPILPLVDQAPVRPSPPRAPEPKVDPTVYVVEKGGNVVLGGHVVNLRPGKLLDPRSYDVATLLKEPSIRLRKVEP